MTRPTLVSLSAALALCACAAPSSNLSSDGPAPASAPPLPASAPGNTVAQAAATITPEDVYARIEFLASDLLRGRDTPSPGLNIAASYLVNQHKLLGLQPAGENGTFYQWYPFPAQRLSAGAASFEYTAGGRTQALQLGRDFFTGGGTRGAISGAGLVFAGAGGDEVLAEGTMRDRVVVVTLPGRMTRDWRMARTRLRGAAERAGASAVVYVLDEPWTADSVARYAAMAQNPTRTLGGVIGFPQFLLTRDAARRLFTAGGVDFAQAAAQGAAAGFRPVPLAGVTVSAGLPTERLDEGLAPNVVAVLPGSDPALRDEYVVISAHMDHVGVGQPVNGDSIYNGADDDASGTQALVEVAQAMASLAVKPRRSVIFLHVSGEEKGLLGSEWYSEHPTVPLERIVANINVDMIGRNSPDTVVVIGKDYSTLGQTANRIAAEHPELGLILSDDPWPEERFFFRSDHFNFARKEIPAIFFFSGVHADYHRPGDHVEKIDADKAARITRSVFYLAYEVANAVERPRWDPRGLEEVRRLTR